MMLTVTDVVEHEFCPKFTYFSKILCLEQYEEKRGTVKSGKLVHQRHELTNKDYTYKKIQGKKIIAQKYYSKKIELVGKIDEAIETPNEIILVERKFSDYSKITPTLTVQIGLLAKLVEENKAKPVNEAIIIFSKTGRTIIRVKITNEIKNYALQKLEEVKSLIKSGDLPDSIYDNRCLNCCFRKICPTGSLNKI